jgi:glyoxalase family protein
MSERIPGIHHITAIAGDAQRNLDFYTGLLGLQLVKRTVNFDDPGTYHLYFGDDVGRPGTILTFFPWPGATRGRLGTGEVSATSFAIPSGSLGFWSDRLRDAGVATRRDTRFGDTVLGFEDGDGTRLELIESPTIRRGATTSTGVAAEHAIGGFHSATLQLRSRQRTEQLLTASLGLTPAGEEQGRRRFRAAGTGAGAIVDTLESRDTGRGELGAGSVHHIAWRTRDESTQADWLERLPRLGLRVTPVQDRQYFHSIYFREPGGVLFEIATDPPGFAIDEPSDRLGESLRLPPWLEPLRARIERALPALETRPVGRT